MFLKRVLSVCLLACMALPAWAGVAPDYKESQLTVVSYAKQKIDRPLQQFIRDIWAQSPAIKQAQAQVDIARARAEGADMPLYNPDLALDFERTEIDTTSIGISQTLDWSDKRHSRSDIAGQKLKAAEAALQDARQRVAARALNALNHYVTASEMQQLSRQRSLLMKDFVATVKQRQAAGDMGALDGTLAQVAYSEALMQQAASESDLAEAEAELQAVSGLDADAWPGLPDELIAPPEQIDMDRLLQSLPELMVLRSRVEAAKAGIRLAERERKADPNIGVRAGVEDSEALFGITLEIPMFVRNSFKAEVQAASHEVVEKEQAYSDAMRQARARLDSSLQRFRNTVRAWSSWQSAGQQAHRKQMSLLKQMWQAGELTATDYLIQAKQNIDTQVAATTLKGEVWQAAIAWLDASARVERWLDIVPVAQTENIGE